MAHVYEGTPDGRWVRAVPVTRFHPKYRALTDAEKALHDEIKSKATELEALFEQVKPGWYRSLAFTDLESAIIWCIKELTS
jgi:hypothetical protein